MSATLLTHDWQYCPHYIQRAKEIRVALAIDRFIANFFDRANGSITRIVDQNINATKCLLRLGNGCLNVASIGGIKRDRANLLRIGID